MPVGQIQWDFGGACVANAAFDHQQTAGVWIPFEGVLWTVRCLAKPRPVSGSSLFPSAVYGSGVLILKSDQNRVSVTTQCVAGAGMAPAQGRYEMRCWSDYNGNGGAFVDDELNPDGTLTLGGVGMTFELEGGQETGFATWCNYSGTGSFCDGTNWASTPKLLRRYTISKTPQLPPWPPFIPTYDAQNAIQVPEDDGPVPPPELGCRSSVFPGADGTVYVDLRSVVTNPVPGAVDDPGVWWLEWDTEDLEPGPDALGLEVPTTGVPPGGWTVSYWTKRTVDTGYQSSPLYTESMGTIELEGGAPVGGIPSLGFLAGGQLSVDPLETSVHLFDGELSSDPFFFWSTSWIQCHVRVDPARAGLASGDSVVVVIFDVDNVTTITETDGTWPAPPPGPGGGGGGGGSPTDGCGIPSGGFLSTINPLNWAGALGCVFGNLLEGLLDGLLAALRALADAVGSVLEFLEGLVSAVGDLLELLFVPSEESLSWDTELAAIEQAQPYRTLEGMGAIYGGVIDGAPSGGVQGSTGSCFSVPIGSGSYGVSGGCVEDSNALQLFRLVVWLAFAACLSLAFFSRVLRSAPWAKGRNNGEPE